MTFCLCEDGIFEGSKMGRGETKVISTHIPLPLAEKVDQLATRLERSRGSIIEEALNAWVEQEEQARLTYEAMADVDAGRLITHEAMQAWADSLDTENPLPPPTSP